MTIRMRVALLAFSLSVLSLSVAAAKKKAQVPDFILKAQTVCVLIDPDAGNGLRQPSIALVFQLCAIDKRFFEGRLGTVSESVLASLLSALEEITAP